MSVILEEQITSLPSAEDIFQKIVDSLSMESQDTVHSFASFIQNYINPPLDMKLFQGKFDKLPFENNFVYLGSNTDLASPYRANEMRKMQPFLVQSKVIFESMIAWGLERNEFNFTSILSHAYENTQHFLFSIL